MNTDSEYGYQSWVWLYSGHWCVCVELIVFYVYQSVYYQLLHSTLCYNSITVKNDSKPTKIDSDWSSMSHIIINFVLHLSIYVAAGGRLEATLWLCRALLEACRPAEFCVRRLWVGEMNIEESWTRNTLARETSRSDLREPV